MYSNLYSTSTKTVFQDFVFLSVVILNVFHILHEVVKHWKKTSSQKLNENVCLTPFYLHTQV